MAYSSIAAACLTAAGFVVIWGVWYRSSRNASGGSRRNSRSDGGTVGTYRCSPCGVSWPKHSDYAVCPECLTKTDSLTDEPINEAEAHSRLTHARFERWLDDNNRRGPAEQLERIPTKDDDEGKGRE